MKQEIITEEDEQPPGQFPGLAYAAGTVPGPCGRDSGTGYHSPLNHAFISENGSPVVPDVHHPQWSDWRWQMANRLLTLDALCRLPGVNPLEKEQYRSLIGTFHYAVTPYYLSLIDWADPQDPVRIQSLPDLKETGVQVSGNQDPLEEDEDMQVPGLVHRYPDRVLAVVTSVCAMYCRHCTRKRIWKDGKTARTKKDLAAMVNYVRRTPEVREVIISGGDPLTMNMDHLDWFMGELHRISHVEVLRIGTRVPVVLPMRITDDLVKMLASHRPLWLNTQFNHPREITPEAQEACDRLLRAGIPVSNQTVLLKGVNDSVPLMRDLLHGLQRIMVRPYYLFQCDPVMGVEHLRTSVWKGVEIIEKLRGHTGGLCVPTFVVDAPGGGGKVPLQPFYLVSATDREIVMRNYEGMIITYDNPREGDEAVTGPDSGNETHRKGDGPVASGVKIIGPAGTARLRRRKLRHLSLHRSGGGR